MASPCQRGTLLIYPPLLPRGIGGAEPASGCQQLGMRLEPARSCLSPSSCTLPSLDAPRGEGLSRHIPPSRDSCPAPCAAWHSQAGQNPPAPAINGGIRCRQLRWDPLYRRVLTPPAKTAWGTQHGLGVPGQGDSPCSSSVTPLHRCWGPGCLLGDRVQRGVGGRPQHPAAPRRPVC